MKPAEVDLCNFCKVAKTTHWTKVGKRTVGTCDDCYKVLAQSKPGK